MKRSVWPGDEDELIAVSPRHTVRLEPDYAALVRRAPGTDFVVRTIVKREANGLPLMSADIVIAGAETRERYPAARMYPLHFRKTLYPARLHGDPRHEFELQMLASTLISVPPPIGSSHNSFRSCLVPGLPYSRLSPFGVDPAEGNIAIAQQLPLASAAGLWRLAEEAFGHLSALHAGGMAHGDAELHNFVVCPSPLEVVVIDFEVAIRKEEVTTEVWEKTCRNDMLPLLREAIYLQCALGQQPGPLADAAWQRIDELFQDPERFRREVGRSTTPNA